MGACDDSAHHWIRKDAVEIDPWEGRLTRGKTGREWGATLASSRSAEYTVGGVGGQRSSRSAEFAFSHQGFGPRR